MKGFTRIKNLTKAYSEKIPVVHRAFANLVMYEDMNLAELLPPALLRVPEGLAPSFASYTVKGEYIVKVTAVVRCIDKLFEVEVGKVAIDILPKTLRGAAEGNASTNANGAGLSAAVSSSLTPNSILQPPPPLPTTTASASAGAETVEEETLPPYATQDPNQRSSRAGPPVVF